MQRMMRLTQQQTGNASCVETRQFGAWDRWLGCLAKMLGYHNPYIRSFGQQPHSSFERVVVIYLGQFFHGVYEAGRQHPPITLICAVQRAASIYIRSNYDRCMTLYAKL